MSEGPKRLPLALFVLAAGMAVLGVLWGPRSFRTSAAPGQVPRDFRVERPPAPSGPSAPEVDDLATVLKRSLEEVVKGEDVTQAQLEDRLIDAMNREQVGYAELRSDAAKDVAFMMINAAEEFEGAEGGSEEMRQKAVRQQAGLLLRDLYLATEHKVEVKPETFGPPPKGYQPLPLGKLAAIEYREGKPLPEEVRAYDGQRVAVQGFLVEAGPDELLLVKSLWSCCFGTPPEVHEVVVVKFDGELSDAWFDGVVQVAGTLEVGEEREDDLVLSIYRMKGSRVDLPE